MKKQILVFPGQGSQVAGMGKDFFENFKESRHVFEEASDVLKIKLTKICFEGPLDELTKTENLQPALYTTEIAILTALKIHANLNVAAVAGHSLGEYSALAAAESFEFPEGLKLTRLRGDVMQKAVLQGLGAMAAVLGLGADLIESLCNKVMNTSGEICEPANYNSNEQVVISGTKTGVDKAIEILNSDDEYKGGKAIPLQVSAPFHCLLMKPAQDAMKVPLANTVFKKPQFLGAGICLIPNVTATPTDDETKFAGLLTEQIVKSVRWEQSMQKLAGLEIEELIEVGPGKVLTGLMRRINKGMPTKNISSVETLKGAFK